MEKVYVLTARETGEVFSSYLTEDKANKALIAQEAKDMEDEVYESNFYFVSEIYSNDVRFEDALKFADK